MKKDQKQSLDDGRRDFLRGSLVTGVGVATAAVLPSAALADEPEAPSLKTERQGYQLTQHVLDYYRTAAS